MAAEGAGPAAGAPKEARDFEVEGAGGVRLSGRDSGPVDGRVVLLLHGLSMTRDAVLMNSRDLERDGFRVISYDMRGHGRSGAPADGDHSYETLVADLVRVMEDRGVAEGRVVLVGNSAGAHTALRYTLACPERVAGLLIVTPAYHPSQVDEESRREAAGLVAALREGKVDDFVALARPPGGMPPSFARALLRRRLAAHDDLVALADALEAHPLQRPFEDLSELSAITVPALVVGTQDDVDPRHPLAVARAYAEALGDARFVVEEPGEAPIAWSRRRIAPLALELARAASWEPERSQEVRLRA